jgi:hypothetical protein
VLQVSPSAFFFIYLKSSTLTILNYQNLFPSAIRYPELSVLTEMTFPVIFFPINEEAENMTESQACVSFIVSAVTNTENSMYSQGFFIRLDDKELVVRSCYGNRKFRISQDGCVTRIEEAFVIGQPIELQIEES